MELIYAHIDAGNFGDDMNPWLWEQLLPGRWEKDGTLFYGIGTILSARVPAHQRKIVFGSGAGYRRTRPRLDTTWDVRFVRGPYSARYLGLPNSIAISDPALLARQLIPPASRNGSGRPVFLPHHVNDHQADWRKVCTLAGIDYISPTSSIQTVIERTQSASCVLAESMHAAVIADAYRVPWIPVVAHPKILAFKWRDWCASIELPYHPHYLKTSLRDAKAGETAITRTRIAAKKSIATLTGRPLGRLYTTRASNEGDYALAAASLEQCARMEPTLSTDTVFHRCEVRILEQVDRLRREG